MPETATSPKKRFTYDQILKLILSDKACLSELLQNYSGDNNFTSRLDFRTITCRNIEYHDAVLQRSYRNDIAVNINYLDSSPSSLPLHLVIMLELQSTSQRHMALRMANYTNQIYSDIAKNNGSQLLPHIIPIVFYTGSKRWTAPYDVKDLIDTREAPRIGNQTFLLQHSYYLIDVKRTVSSDICPNLAHQLIESLKTNDLDELERLRIATREMLHRYGNEINLDAWRLLYFITGERLYEEDHNMNEFFNEDKSYEPVTDAELDELLSEIRRTGWRARAKAEGRAEGLAEGRAEGEAKGRAEGEAKGRAEGRAEGEAKGRAEGELATLQYSVHTMFAQHFSKDLPKEWLRRHNLMLNMQNYPQYTAAILQSKEPQECLDKLEQLTLCQV